MPLPTLVARQYTTKGLLSLANTDGLGYLGMKELEQKMRGRNRHVSMSLTRVVEDPGYLTQNDTSSVKFAYILTVWQHMYIIHTYSIKKNVSNHKCAGIFYGYYVQNFSGIFTFNPPPPKKEKSQEKNYIYKIIGSKFQLSVNPIFCIN